MDYQLTQYQFLQITIIKKLYDRQKGELLSSILVNMYDSLYLLLSPNILSGPPG